MLQEYLASCPRCVYRTTIIRPVTLCITDPAYARTSYRYTPGAAQAFSESFRHRCLEHHIDFIEIDTGEPYDTALLTYLNKRAKLK